MKTDRDLVLVPDTQVLLHLDTLHQTENQTQSEFLAYLNAVEERRLYAGAGYSSLFTFLVEHFRYSESSALRRIQVARLARRFEQAYWLLSQGAVSLSHLQLLSPHITAQNADRLLQLAQEQGVRELQASLAAEFPRPGGPDRSQPLGKESYEIQFTADQVFFDKLNQAKTLLGRKYPQGKLVQVLGDALDLLLKYEGDRQCRPVPTPGQKACGVTQEDLEEQERAHLLMQDPHLKNTPRYIRRRIRREVWKRDGGKCQFKRPDGSICGETKFLEFDHVLPWAHGGSSHSTENVRLLCRSHNQWNARQDFGPFPKVRAKEAPPEKGRRNSRRGSGEALTSVEQSWQ